MKRETLRILLMAGMLSIAATGCYSHRQQPAVVTTTGGEVIVTEAPPPLRREVRGIAPSASQLWIEGYWSHRNGRWLLVPGHWEVRPQPTATYVPGHWDRTSRGWAWTPGRWE